MRTTELLDDIQYELGMMENSVGWNTQRPVVLRKLRTSADLLEADFRDRLRFVPNVLLKNDTVGNYDDPESLTTYTVPHDCDPQRISSLSVEWTGIWHPIRQGITQQMRDDAYALSTTYIAWDVTECGRIEAWPNPVEALPLRISYYRKPNDYRDEEGCIDMDATLLNLLTLDQCIPFYKRPDADSVNRKLNRHLGNIRAKQIQNQRFFVGIDDYRGGTPNAADQIYCLPPNNGATT
jgi:hypothetical protein